MTVVAFIIFNTQNFRNLYCDSKKCKVILKEYSGVYQKTTEFWRSIQGYIRRQLNFEGVFRGISEDNWILKEYSGVYQKTTEFWRSIQGYIRRQLNFEGVFRGISEDNWILKEYSGVYQKTTEFLGTCTYYSPTRCTKLVTGDLIIKLNTKQLVLNN